MPCNLAQLHLTQHHILHVWQTLPPACHDFMASTQTLHYLFDCRSQTPPPGSSSQKGPINYAPANIWGGAVAAHQAATGGPAPKPSPSSYQSSPQPPSHSYNTQHQQQQHQQQQQEPAQPAQAVISVSLLSVSLSCRLAVVHQFLFIGYMHEKLMASVERIQCQVGGYNLKGYCTAWMDHQRLSEVACTLHQEIFCKSSFRQTP